tara:strand:+ start:8740 stop:9222 length:483 start_codon:yes stop_codon:yes gene_type:complete
MGKFKKPNNNYVDEINERISYRNIPSQTLPPIFSNRPTSTKFNNLQKNKLTKIKKNEKQSEDLSNVFMPITDYGPWSKYAQNIETETELKIATSNLGGEGSIYIPSSKSDLYNETKINNTNTIRPLLFNTEQFNTFNPNVGNVGDKIFMNHTRQQLKNIL